MKLKKAATKRGVGGGAEAVAGAEASAPQKRGRPGRRSVEDRATAVLELLSGKASVDQLAARFGVQPATVERWREIALEGLAQALRQGSGKSPREVALEKQLKSLERAFTDVAIKKELIERALAERPSQPGRSWR